MKTVATLVSLFLFVTVVAQQPRKIKIDALAEQIRKSDHPLVVSFWATWCAPCVEEIPHLQEAVKAQAAQKVEFILVSLDFPTYYPTKVTEFLAKRKFEASLYWLDETNADLFCPKIDEKWTGAIPATLFINQKSGYRKFYEQQLKKDQIDEEIKKLVK